MSAAAAPASTFPHIDAARQDSITDEQADFFRDNGLLVIRNVVRGEELAALQRETQALIDQARAGVDHPDWLYREHEITGERVPFRVEYVIDRCAATKALLGHPFILGSVEKLQGRNFIPTWDSMVFKNPGAGVAIPWHRDAGTGNIGSVGSADRKQPVFNVDFYLDRADLGNCLWGILGSNRWSNERADAVVQQLNAGGFQRGHGAVPIPMEPGDVILHNITAIHGSPPAQSALRRVLYYEFRPGEFERELGPHYPIYIPLKQRVLLACLRHRAATAYAQGEKPFVYQPSAEFAPPELTPDEKLHTYRYPHQDYWRS